MPAKAGIQNYLKTLDSRLRGNDVKGRFKTFYETIKFDKAAETPHEPPMTLCFSETRTVLNFCISSGFHD